MLPVAVLYVVGAMLVIFGSLRAFMLGWQRRDRQLDDEVTSGRQKGPRYHLVVGIFWVVLGLGLVISTYLQSARLR
jgi:uncharacterized membrane protein